MTQFGTGDGHYRTALHEERRTADGSTWYAEHPDLPGCHAVGDSQDAALVNLERSREAWLASARARGMEIPKPRADPSVQVQYALRHDVEAAKQQDVDLGGEEIVDVVPHQA